MSIKRSVAVCFAYSSIRNYHPETEFAVPHADVFRFQGSQSLVSRVANSYLSLRKLGGYQKVACSGTACSENGTLMASSRLLVACTLLEMPAITLDLSLFHRRCFVTLQPKYIVKDEALFLEVRDRSSWTIPAILIIRTGLAQALAR